jgi:hypothetical protein
MADECATIPSEIRVFFGSTGTWRGKWTSPQTKGSYEVTLVLKQFKAPDQVEVAYVTPDYPDWYITARRYETIARFIRRPDRGLVLSVPYAPAHTTMEFWFEGPALRGILYGRFMKSVITLKPAG